MKRGECTPRPPRAYAGSSPHEAEQLTRGHLEAEPSKRLDVPEAALEVDELEHLTSRTVFCGRQSLVVGDDSMRP